MLGVTTSEGWQPGIGDPTVGGWITVAAYLVTGIFALNVFWGYQRDQPPKSLSRSGFFWFCLGLFLLALGINKQLDLQSWFTQVGKQVAQAQGWYENRRIVQIIFIILIAVLAMAAFLGLLRLMRGNFRRHGFALAGAAFLFAFVVIRAGSFHHIDAMLGWRLGGLKMNWLFELGGIALIFFAGLREVRARNSVRPSPRRSY